MQNLHKPENKQQLDKVLTYHVVSGRYDTARVNKLVQEGGGKAELKTVKDGPLTITGSGMDLMVADEKVDMARVTIPNVYQSNGVIMVVNHVLLPS